MSEYTTSHAPDLTKLAENMQRIFSNDELTVLCHRLRVDPDEVKGQTKTLRVWELIGYMERQRTVMELVEEIKKMRPGFNLTDVKPDEPVTGKRVPFDGNAQEREDVTKTKHDHHQTSNEESTEKGKPTVDVLLVTVTKVEALTVLNLFEKRFGQSPQLRHIGIGTYYEFGQIGEANIWMIRSEMGSGGPSGSTLTISDAIRDVKPTAIIMVGIAFGVNETKQKIGDVLVSKQLLGYELQRIGTDKEGEPVIMVRGDRASTSPQLLQRFRDGELSWDEAEVRFGLMLSGDKLVDNFDFREQLKGFEPEAIGGEMEGSGLYAAAQRQKVDWIIVKSICDWADGKKHEDKQVRQNIAAQNAANFVFHVIEQGGFGTGTTSHPIRRVLHNQKKREKVLDAAVKKEVKVGESTVVLALIRDIDSKGLQWSLKIESDYKLQEKDVLSSREFLLYFPVDEQGNLLPTDVDVDITADGFTPQWQSKTIEVAPFIEIDNKLDPVEFLLTPNKPGELQILVEVYQKAENSRKRVGSKFMRTQSAYNPSPHTPYLVISLMFDIFGYYGKTEANHTQENQSLAQYNDTIVSLLLPSIERQIGDAWMFKILYDHVSREGSIEDQTALTHWLQKIIPFASKQIIPYVWQLLCLDKHIQLIGVSGMPPEFMSSFSQTFPLHNRDSTDLLGFVIKQINELIETIFVKTETLSKTPSLFLYINLLNQIVSDIDRLEKTLEGTESLLSLYGCLVNDKGEPLPQDKVLFGLKELKRYLASSISQLKTGSVPTSVKLNITNRLKQLSVYCTNYGAWLDEVVTKIEHSRKTFFSVN